MHSINFNKSVFRFTTEFTDYFTFGYKVKLLPQKYVVQVGSSIDLFDSPCPYLQINNQHLQTNKIKYVHG